MPPIVASVICSVGIAGLFWLERAREARTSPALWIPMIWLSIACSRSVSGWLAGRAGRGYTSAEQVLEGSPTDRLVFLIVIAVGLFVLVARHQQVGKLLKANGPILLFFLYGAMSILWSDFPEVAFKRWYKAVGDLVMILVVLSDREAYAAIKRFLARPTYVLLPLSILFIKYYPELGVGYGPWGGPGAYQGVTTNKNTLGVICMGFGLASLWRFLNLRENPERPKQKLHLIAEVAVLAMSVCLLWISNSMTSLNCFAMGTILILASRLRMVQRNPRWLHLSAILMIAVSASIAFLGLSPETLAAMGRNPTLTDRTEVWRWLFKLSCNPIVGCGFESFWLGPRLAKLWEVYWWHPNEAHNGYIEVYINLGWLGIVLLAGVILSGYRSVFRAYARFPQLGILCIAYFVPALSYNFTEAALFRMLAPEWLFMLLAMVVAAAICNDIIRPSGQEVAKPSLAFSEEQVASVWNQVG